MTTELERQAPQAPGEMTLREQIAKVIRPHVYRWHDDDNYSIEDIATVLAAFLSTRDAARDAEIRANALEAAAYIAETYAPPDDTYPVTPYGVGNGIAARIRALSTDQHMGDTR